MKARRRLADSSFHLFPQIRINFTALSFASQPRRARLQKCRGIWDLVQVAVVGRFMEIRTGNKDGLITKMLHGFYALLGQHQELPLHGAEIRYADFAKQHIDRARYKIESTAGWNIL